MSRRNWGNYTPLGVGLIVVLAIGAIGLHNHHEKSRAPNRGTQQERADAFGRSPSAIIGLAANKAPVANPNPERDEWREEQDLQAQKDMAAWAWNLLIATWAVGVASLIVTTAGVVYVARTLGANRKSAEAAAEQVRILREDQRAWVRIDMVPFSDIRKRNAGGFDAKITLQLTNVGRSIATEARASIKPYVLPVNNPAPRRVAEQWLEARLTKPHPLRLTRVVFPNETISLEFDLRMTRSEIAACGSRGRYPDVIRVAARVDYRTPSVEGMRHTLVNFVVTDSVRRTLDFGWPIISKGRIRVIKGGAGEAT